MTDVGAIFAADRAALAAGIELLASGPGSARTALTVRPDQVNGLDGVHGGVIFLLADTAFAVACNSHGRPTVARSCQIEFLSGATIGDRLEARASERMRTGRNGIYDVAVTRAPDGLLIAEMRGNSRELPPT
jgi:acyl-CoA thioesterase